MKSAKNDNRRANTRLNPDQYLGNFIRKYRLEKGLTLSDISARASISKSMLSKIENGQASPSLHTIARLAQALGVTLSTMFSNYDIPSDNAQLVKAGKGMEVVRRGTREGHTYHLLAYNKGPKQLFEPFLITIKNKSETFPTFEHTGIEFIYMLEGKLKYRYGQFTYLLEPGDALTFHGDIPHGPEQLIDVPIRFLAIINYNVFDSDDTNSRSQ
ncbi:helix-turn-helix domain-containing protein [Rubrobacter xylanophilus]|nr:XRE family transcriptional regulator [Rubrobacter xylanophilus]